MVTMAVDVVFLVVSAAVTAFLGGYAARNRQEPGAVPFALMMASLVVWSAVYAVGLVTTDPTWRPFLQRVMWVGPATINVWVFLFALTYTGYGEVVSRRTVGLLCVVPAVVVLGVWTNPLHHLLWTDQSVVVVDGLAVMNPSFGPLFWLQVVYSYAMIAVAATLLVRLVSRSDYLYTDQSVLLLVGILTPVVLNVADVFGLFARPGVDYTPHAFTVTGVAFGYALFRRRLFDLVPATRQLGRNAAISQLDDGVIIVDTSRRIVYCNAAAGEVIGSDPAAVLGVSIQSVIDESRLDFGTEDALAEIDRDGRTYEVRTSPITDRRDHLIGHTLLVHDVTASRERERRLAAQRDELATVNDLNAVLRGVNQGLVSATGREAIERTVCERLADADLYRTACVGDVATWTGAGDRWVIAGDEDEFGHAPPAVDADLATVEVEEAPTSATRDRTLVDAADDGTWTVVPLVYGRTVYGALGLYTDRESVSERERAVLGELGETVGHAINAAETRRLLSAEAVVELELRSLDADDPLVAASDAADCRLTVAGIVPGGDAGDVAYVGVEGAATAAVCDPLRAATGDEVRPIREADDGLLEWRITDDAVLRSLREHGAHVRNAHAEAGVARYELEIASGADVRAMVDHVTRRFPETRVVSKRERARPVDRPEPVTGDVLADLTDRQREAIEAAYRAGYFNWPRDSTAEEVAETLDIASSTLHGHLRKAHHSLLEQLFDGDGGR